MNTKRTPRKDLGPPINVALVRQQVEARGWDSKEFSDKLGISQSYACNILQGRRTLQHAGRTGMVNKIAAALGLPADVLTRPPA